MQLVKWHILKSSMDSQMRLLYEVKLKREKAGKIGRGRKAYNSTPCMQIEGLLKEVNFLKSFHGQQDKVGIGFGVKKKFWQVKSVSGERKALCTLKRQHDEEQRLKGLFHYKMQNNWMKWGLLEELEGEQLTMEKVLYSYSHRLLSFTVNSTLNTLPTPYNLSLWGKQSEAVCGLCGKMGVAIGHILGGCSWVRQVENGKYCCGAGAEDRYTWRHNNVLRVISTALIKKLSERNALGELNQERSHLQPVDFVREGQQISSKPKVSSARRKDMFGWLSQASDWKAAFDLPELKTHCTKYLPRDICDSRHEIDSFMFSREAKLCILGPEITVPMEENMNEWQLKKLTKYTENMKKHFKNDWQAHVVTIEVGCRGYVSGAFRKSLAKFGFSNKEIDVLRDKCSYISRLSSLSIWLSRFSREFHPDRLVELDLEAFVRIAHCA
mmetsp:Transcript_15472/g.19388  ORF Transcript_15472/g.19388 Transcript_15472/m.19388 type:complete len:439 (+) Transcript_15472:120-1436(+)